MKIGEEIATTLIKNLEEKMDAREKSEGLLTDAFKKIAPQMRGLMYKDATQYAKKKATIAKENWEFYRENKKFKSEEEEARRLKRFMQKKYIYGAERFLCGSEKLIEFEIFSRYKELFGTYYQFYMFSKKNLYLLYSGIYDRMIDDSESIKI